MISAENPRKRPSPLAGAGLDVAHGIYAAVAAIVVVFALKELPETRDDECPETEIMSLPSR
jgi:hypothetical protein